MRSIDHLSPAERQHFIKCSCGNYLDMRELKEVVSHLYCTPESLRWKFDGPADARADTAEELKYLLN